MTYSWGQKVVRFYDLDGNLIEVRTLVQKNSENSKDENKQIKNTNKLIKYIDKITRVC